MNYHAPEIPGAPGWAASSTSQAAWLWNSIQLGDSALQSVLDEWSKPIDIDDMVKIESWIQFIYTLR